MVDEHPEKKLEERATEKPHIENNYSGKTEEYRTLTDRVRENPWVLSTVVLGIVTVLLLIGQFTGGVTGGVTGVAKQTDVETKVIDFLNSQVTNGSVTLVKSEVKNGLYEITVSYQGAQIPVYATLDGEALVQGVTPLSVLEQQLSNANSGANTGAQQQNSPVDIPIGNSPVLGNVNAKLTIVEFSDFSCPFCGAASGLSVDMVASMKQRSPTWEPAVPGIIKDYVNTGKAKFVYKYSLGHSGGKPATLIGFCLNDQNLFWKFHDKAFANQADVEDLAKMKALAQSIGADMVKLNACLDSKKYDSKLGEDEALGQSIGIGGTPAIYANGIKVANGAESYVDVKKAIDAVLATVSA